MQTLRKTTAALVASTLLSACGGEDFTGAYRVTAPSSKSTMIINVRGENAEVFVENKDGRIIPGPKLIATIKGKKLLLGDTQSGQRLALTRNVDERSLDCLNCKAFGLKDDVQLQLQLEPTAGGSIAQRQRCLAGRGAKRQGT